jgi:hypothetical protein
METDMNLINAAKYLEKARELVCDSYPTQTARKLVQGKASRAYEEAIGYTDNVPYSIAHFRTKHEALVRSAEALAIIKAAVEVYTTAKAAPIVAPQKARGPSESHPIIVAVRPLREDAVSAAEAAFREVVTKALAIIKAADCDLNAVAPTPVYHGSSWGPDRAAYKAAQARRAFLWSLVEADANRLTNGYDTGRPLYVVGSTEKIERAFEQVRQNAGAAFDSFAAKLVGKVGDCTAATLHCWGDVWTSSTLVVTKADGSVERWNTQRIINCSVLGKLFHQWPTRKAA